MEQILLNIVNKSNNPLPAYETSGSSGMDLRAFVSEPVTIKPGHWALIHTGLYMEIPYGFEGQIRSRSGLALKKGIIVKQGIGTIDSDYRDEVCVILQNDGFEDFTVNNGDRIAQIVFARYAYAGLKVVEKLNTAIDRGGGLGHTGV